MTTAGLQIINDGGNIQIDQNFVALAFIGKYTCTLTEQTGASGLKFQKGTVTVPGSLPVIAFACTQPVLISGADVSGGNTTFTFWGAPSTPNYNATVYVFGRPADSGLNFGLQVFDASGGLVFDSGWTLMKVVDFITPTSTSTKTEPSGKTYAIVQSFRPLTYINTGGLHPVLELSGVGVSISGNTISGLTVLVEDGRVTSWTGPMSSAITDLVVDVTGL